MIAEQLDTAFVAFGGNLGDPASTLRAAVSLVEKTLGKVRAVSSLYEAEPLTLDGEPQPNYINAVFSVETALCPQEMLRGLLEIEHQLGRDRSGAQRWQPRTIDLDLLFHGSQIQADDFVIVPHPEWSRRDFVLLPLFEIAPTLVDPVSGRPLSAIVADLHEGGAPRCVIRRLFVQER